LTVNIYVTKNISKVKPIASDYTRTEMTHLCNFSSKRILGCIASWARGPNSCKDGKTESDAERQEIGKFFKLLSKKMRAWILLSSWWVFPKKKH